MERVDGPAPITDAAEQEIQARITSVWVGIYLTLIASAGACVYVLLTWDQPNRNLILAVAILGLLSAPAVRALPIERMVRSRRRELYFITWTVGDIVIIATSAALDGGTQSPFALLLVLPFLFGALSYPLWATSTIGAVDVAAYVAVAVFVGGGFPYSGFGAFGLVCVALMAAWESRNQARRRSDLAGTAQALRISEERTRLQASQQREVANFGQLALSGVSIDHLQSEAVQQLQRMLEVEIAAVLRQAPDGDYIEMTAQVGIPEPDAGKVRIPLGVGSQAGYTLITGNPILVANWDEETRFGKSPILVKHGVLSGVTVLINGKDAPWGVIGIQSKRSREFGADDVNFMQAIANVLANAIERRETEELTRHQALHDPLTDLPNRTLFLDRLEHALVATQRRQASVGVLFLDLDQFKLVNDSLGHAAGDELLAAVAPRLQQALRPGDTVARFGGDEFAVLAEDIENERDAIRIAERILESLTRPFILRRREHFASASIGISIASGGEEPEALIRDADAALYRAKERGRAGYEIFDEVMRSRVIDHVQTENDLRRALQRRELELHYQPIIDLRDGSTAMFEALLRWHHPERGLLGPAAFIPVAEESRLIVPIGRWVIEEACRAAAKWQGLYPDARPIGVSVNLSARQLADPELLRCVKAAVAQSGIDPATLLLELTETTLLEEAETPEIALEALGELGVRIVLDDFGTGFSSLGYLKRLPLSGIKLDRAFVEHLAEGGKDAAIVRAVTGMASALGLAVCAEGVETPEQLELVRKLRCTHAQGFHFARPGPESEVAELLAATNPATAP